MPKLLTLAVALLVGVQGAEAAQKTAQKAQNVQNMAQKVATPRDIDWEAFLGQHDFHHDTIPADYYAGAIMGNGLLGSNIYRQGEALRIDIGRVDVTEGRMPADRSHYNALYHAARLPIGYFTLTPAQQSGRSNMHFDLWNATATGHLNGVDFKSYVHATRNVIVMEVDGRSTLKWHPLKAVSPRLAFGNTDYPQDYVENPNPEVRVFTDGMFDLSVQNLVGGKTYVVAWLNQMEEDGDRRIIATIAQERSEQLAIEAAKKRLLEAIGTGSNVLEEEHQEWWHNYYPASYADFGDKNLEAFYWRQQYKFGCLTRPDGHIVDLQGPWAVQKTPWPAVWYNLNIQLTYSPLVTANRAAMTEPVWRALWENRQNLEENAGGNGYVFGRSGGEDFLRVVNSKEGMLYEVANLTWLLSYYHEYCLATGSTEELRDKFFPLLKGAVAYYEHIRERRADGLWHLPETASPEYRTARDCNYDLAVLRWGLQTLLSLNKEFDLKDPHAAQWQEFLSNLTPYPVDPERGLMIGEGVNLTESHRHYSHLLMIYPLHTLTDDRALIEKSVANWQSMPRWLQGYSFTGSASIYAMLGYGDRAVKQLQTLLAKFIQPNTLYKETGPVIETPLAGAASLQELYLQSWGGVVRIFPAVPAVWPSAEFVDFRAAGAFLVSARRSQGRTVFVQISSEHGGECVVKTDMDLARVRARRIGGGRVSFTVLDGGLLKLNMQPGEVIQIS